MADCVELVHDGYICDAIVTVGGCDKTNPGVVMPLARNNYLGISMYPVGLRSKCLDVIIVIKGISMHLCALSSFHTGSHHTALWEGDLVVWRCRASWTC